MAAAKVQRSSVFVFISFSFNFASKKRQALRKNKAARRIWRQLPSPSPRQNQFKYKYGQRHDFGAETILAPERQSLVLVLASSPFHLGPELPTGPQRETRNPQQLAETGHPPDGKRGNAAKTQRAFKTFLPEICANATLIDSPDCLPFLRRNLQISVSGWCRLCNRRRCKPLKVIRASFRFFSGCTARAASGKKIINGTT